MGDMGLSKEGEQGDISRSKNMDIRTTLTVGVSALALAGAVITGANESGKDPLFTKETYIATNKPDIVAANYGLSVGGSVVKNEEITLITYNTASGNPKIKTPQSEFVKLSFYQKVIQGAPDAPIIGLQEVGEEQKKKLAELARKTNNFSYEYINSRGSRDGNLLLIPKRFEVLKSESAPYPFKAQVKGMEETVRKKGFHLNTIGQLYTRMWSEVRVKDHVTGKTLTIGNTHQSYVNEIQSRQADVTVTRIKAAQKYGPVLYIGDFNADPKSKDSHGKLFKAKMEQAGAVDLSPEQKMNIDQIWGVGFTLVKGRVIYENLPGYNPPSDHKGEETTVLAK